MKTLALAAALTGLAISAIAQGPGGPGHGGPGQRGPGGPGQRGPGGPGMGRMQMGGPGLLMMPEVQQELRLTDQQKEQVRELIGRGPGGPGGPGGGAGFGGGRGQGGPGQAGPGQGGGRMGQGGRGQGGPGGPGGQRGPGGDQRGQELEAKIKSILNDGQFKRYQELSLQHQGAAAVTRPDVAQKLGITEDQHAQIRQILESNRPQRPQPGQEGARPDPEEMRKRMEAMRAETNKKLLAVLTADQRSQWNTMLGTPFKFPEPRRRGGE